MSVIGNPKTVEIDGIKYYVEALDLERLYANLAKADEEVVDLRLHASRNPDEPEWTEKADIMDKECATLREAIKAKREHNGNN